MKIDAARKRAGEWRRNPHGEWVCDGLGVVVSVLDRLFYAYSVEGARLGPFATLPGATQALEAQAG
jgi:hypothetical protein